MSVHQTRFLTPRDRPSKRKSDRSVSNQFSIFFYFHDRLFSGKSKTLVMLTKYLQAALHKAKYKILTDDGTFFGEIPGFQGLWANADALETCREELAEVLEDWILLRISQNLPLPVVDGIELSIKEVA
ncbi:MULTISPECIES: type II toxin-antitoxin system HicB family antitoxin [Planktothrix]|jgi:predicted RNase H-like HicB family nuclease|nr:MULTISPECIES: type II toxin-antitoxin system HicB family antitoxin [Planktothrix]